jgi:hypothetical protein
MLCGYSEAEGADAIMSLIDYARGAGDRNCAEVGAALLVRLVTDISLIRRALVTLD